MTNSEHLVPLQQRLLHVHTHAHFKHKLLGVTNTKKKNTTQQGKVARSKVFADLNFGIEIAGKQKGTKSGFGDLAAGDVTSAQALVAPQAWKGAAAGLALQPLKRQSTWQERSYKTWRLPAPPRGRQPGGTPLVTPRGNLGVCRQEGRLEPESDLALPC